MPSMFTVCLLITVFFFIKNKLCDILVAFRISLPKLFRHYRQCQRVKLLLKILYYQKYQVSEAVY